tara:strand:+ start:390 stop:740 length:351 start_codon:yes stop_codon:yes gene_type:complete
MRSAFKMKGFSGFGNSPVQQRAQLIDNPDKSKVKKKEKELPKKVTTEGYGIQNVSKIQEDKKGLFMTGLNNDFSNQEGTSDTTYIPKGMKHYSGKTYKKGDYMDETDFEEMFKKKK